MYTFFAYAIATMAMPTRRPKNHSPYQFNFQTSMLIHSKTNAPHGMYNCQIRLPSKLTLSTYYYPHDRDVSSPARLKYHTPVNYLNRKPQKRLTTSQPPNSQKYYLHHRDIRLRLDAQAPPRPTFAIIKQAVSPYTQPHRGVFREGPCQLEHNWRAPGI